MSFNQTKTKLLSRMIAATIAMGTASLASAQLEEVVVTAQKHSESANDVGITVNAFTGDTIKNLGVATAEDIAAFTPGLALSDSGFGIPTYAIRGVGFQDGVTVSSSSTVGLYFDEVSIPYAVMSRGALYDIERVEVLKGPQGDLYGRNTTAGQINYISNKPTEEFEAGVTASYGRFETLDVEGYVSGSLSDSVQGRVSFKTTQSGEGWQKSLTRPGDTLGEKDVNAIRGLFNFDINQDANLLLKLNYVKVQSDNQAQTAYNGELLGLPPIGAAHRPLDQYYNRNADGTFSLIDPNITPPDFSIGDNRDADWSTHYVNSIDPSDTADLTPRRDNELKGISAKLEWDLGSVTLTSITSYDEFERDDYNDIDGEAGVATNTNNQSKIDVFGQELRLSGRTDQMLWIAGLYYSQDDAEEFYNFYMEDSFFGLGSRAFNVPNGFNAFPIHRLHTRYKQESDSQAIFGHIEYNATDDLRLTAGARYTKEERKWTGCTADSGDGTYASLWNGFFGATLQPGDCSTLDDTAGSPSNIANVLGTPNINDAFHPLTRTIETSKWMGKLGIDYSISDDILVYATLSRGFKSGGFNGNNANTTSQLEPYEPEQLDSLEVGLKATLLENTLQLNAAAFYYEYENKQESEPAITPVGPIGGLGNVPESEIKGVELDIQWAPITGLNVNAGIAYLDTEITKWTAVAGNTLPDGSPGNSSGNFDFATGQPVNVVTFDASGSSLAQAPELSYNLLASYEWAISDKLMMDVSADVNYTDDQPNPFGREQDLDDYTIYNARVAIANADGDWRVMLWGRNITDEYYFTGADGGGNGGYSRLVGMPRTYGVTLDYKF